MPLLQVSTVLFLLSCVLGVLAVVDAVVENDKHVHAVPKHHHHHYGQHGDDGDDHAQILEKRTEIVKTVYEYVTVDEEGSQLGSHFQTPPVHNVYPMESSTVAETSEAAYSQPESSTETSIYTSSSTESASVAAPSLVATDVTTTDNSDSSVSGTFPDGELSCSDFPSAYGALALDYLGFGGWSGIQIDNGAGTECTEGSLCSYACNPGYSKTQWPADQPPDGESRGGLLCSSGKLKLTRPSVTNLCVLGEGSAFLVNNMSSDVAVCRTDYPGSENMVIPVCATPGKPQPLTVVRADGYYVWKGQSTSAQYYVNKAGIPVEDGCLWGSASNNTGNFSPLVFGAGYSDGNTWLSLIPNPEANGEDPGYDVEIVAGDSSTMNGACSYRNGVFSGGANGCTVCVTSGYANYVFTSR